AAAHTRPPPKRGATAGTLEVEAAEIAAPEVPSEITAAIARVAALTARVGTGVTAVARGVGRGALDHPARVGRGEHRVEDHHADHGAADTGERRLPPRRVVPAGGDGTPVHPAARVVVAVLVVGCGRAGVGPALDLGRHRLGQGPDTALTGERGHLGPRIHAHGRARRPDVV